MKLRLTALLLALTLTLSCVVPAFAAETDSPALTRGQALTLITAAAEKYRDEVNPAEVMRDGNAERPVTRAELWVMLSRAFGTLPEPGKDWLRTASEDKYADVPDWAAAEFENLYAGRLLAPGEDLLLNGGETATARELDTYLKRVYALYGTRLQDDFYAAVNGEWLEENEPSVYAPRNVFTELMEKVEKQTGELIKEVVKSGGEKGTAERKIADVYAAFTDRDAQKKTGVTPLKPYIKDLSAVKTLKDLQSARNRLAEELAFFPFINLTFEPDVYDGSRVGVYPHVTSAEGGFEEETDRAYITKIFKNAGIENPEERTELAVKIYTQMGEAHEEIPWDMVYEPFEEQFKKYTAEQIRAMIPADGAAAMLTPPGVKPEPYYLINFSEEHMLKALGGIYTEENAEALAAYTQALLLSSYALYLGDDFSYEISSEDSEKDNEKQAELYENFVNYFMQTQFTGYFSELYVKRYFSPEAKADVTAMVKSFIENYKERIKNLTWMSGATKKAAIVKLDAMNIKIGYSDKRDTFLDGLTIKGADEGGSLLEMLAAINRRTFQVNAQTQGKPVDRDSWSDVTAFEVNAFYGPQGNELMFPAAILTAPFYDANAKPEEKLAGIGYVIAHEITHAFDVNGSQFDAAGSVANWWTDEDKAAFAALNEAVRAHYDGAEVAPGLATDGKLTLGENTADLAGLSCALETLKETVENPDYKLFFTQAAKIWRTAAKRIAASDVVSYNAHSAWRVRVNKSVETFDEFQSAFDIKPGDGMYVAPDERVKIW